MSRKERIQQLCKKKGVTFQQAEADLGFGASYISKLDKSDPTATKLYSMAKYFGVSMEYLYSGEKENPPAFGEGVSEKRKEALDLVMNLPEDELDRFVRTLRAFADK